MSVPKYDRLESEADFLYFARSLAIYTRQWTRKLDKSETFTTKVPFCNLSKDIYHNIRSGNAINYPLNQHEAQMRRDFFLIAKGKLESYSGDIEILKEDKGVHGFTKEIFFDLSDLLRKELKILSGVMKKDRERYKNLP